MLFFVHFMCVWGGWGEAVHAMVHVEISEDKLPEMFLPFRLAVPGAWTQAARPRGKQLCVPSCFAGACGEEPWCKGRLRPHPYLLSFWRTQAWLLVVLSLSPETFLLLLKTVLPTSLKNTTKNGMLVTFLLSGTRWPAKSNFRNEGSFCLTL